MKRVLINFAHPAKSKSKINRALKSAVTGLDNVTVNDLYKAYPDFFIDVEREQKLCEDHDIIIFQHPFYWYSTPSIVREWQDLVLENGWAYGRNGTALKDKYLLQAITAGGDNSTYQKNGYNGFTIRELTTPFMATAKLCKMKWLPPFTVLGVYRGIPEDKLNAYAEDYRRVIIALRDETFNLDEVMDDPYLNSNLNSRIRRP